MEIPFMVQVHKFGFAELGGGYVIFRRQTKEQVNVRVYVNEWVIGAAVGKCEVEAGRATGVREFRI